jgi:Putative peptidoglycan-binding domain-containing protein
VGARQSSCACSYRLSRCLLCRTTCCRRRLWERRSRAEPSDHGRVTARAASGHSDDRFGVAAIKSNAPTTTLKPGDSGSQVKVLQRELVALGFAVGAIDGLYGQATTKAVADFQRAHHLTADGIVGPSTLVALAP